MPQIAAATKRAQAVTIGPRVLYIPVVIVRVLHEAARVTMREAIGTIRPSSRMVGFVSARTGALLRPEGGFLTSPVGERTPVVRGIPRFVRSEGYAAAFGLQWNEHALTQLDSHTGSDLSRVRLERCLGLSLRQVEGLRVLEAGCGAGRFTELLVGARALVHAIDMSTAVDANRQNIGEAPNYVVAQADILALPFPPRSFDIVLCLGVLQHMPSPETAIAALWRMVAPGGLLVIDHYTWTLSRGTQLRALYRQILKRLPPRRAKRITDALVDVFFPLHWALRRTSLLRVLLSRVSPCLAYCHLHPELTRAQHEDWARLDTYDALTDQFKRLRTTGAIQRTLQALGAIEIAVVRHRTVVEARCRKPDHRVCAE